MAVVDWAGGLEGGGGMGGGREGGRPREKRRPWEEGELHSRKFVSALVSCERYVRAYKVVLPFPSPPPPTTLLHSYGSISGPSCLIIKVVHDMTIYSS